MKNVILVFVLFIGFSATAQLNEIKEKLAEYQISEDLLTKNLKDADAEHYFDLKSTTDNGTDTKVELSHFDPAQPVGSRWVLESVNGNPPSSKDFKDFDKTHNTKQPDMNGMADDASWKIVRDDDTYLVVSFAFKKESLPKKYKFLGDCNGLAYFNKKSKKLEKSEFLNNAPLKIKLLKVTHLDMVVKYDWNDTEEAYFISTEEMAMTVDMLGQVIVVKESNEYSNYRKL